MESKRLMRNGCFVIYLLLAGIPLSSAADDADVSTGQGVSQGIEWRSLSSEEQTLLSPFADKWATLPPGRQQRLRKGIKRWASMTPEQRARLFKPFSRLGSDVERAKGHGLGLSIVQLIVEKLGGQAGVESEVGQGSLFWFRLPQYQGWRKRFGSGDEDAVVD